MATWKSCSGLGAKVVLGTAPHVLAPLVWVTWTSCSGLGAKAVLGTAARVLRPVGLDTWPSCIGPEIMDVLVVRQYCCFLGSTLRTVLQLLLLLEFLEMYEYFCF